jgi:hypothetical protein
LQFDRRVAAAAVALGVVGSLALPGPLGEPARRLANSEADGKDPQWDRPVDGAALRRAGRAVDSGATYALDAAGADPVLQGNLKAGAQLFLAPALPVRDPRAADFLLRYRDGRLTLARGAR